MKLDTDRSFSSELQSLVAATNARQSASHAVGRLWACDHRLWKEDPTDITNRLGWLTILEYMKDRTEELRPCLGQGASQGEESVLADSGRAGEITARVGRVRSPAFLRILHKALFLSSMCGPLNFHRAAMVVPQPAKNRKG